MINILLLHSSSELYGSDKSLLNILNNLNKNKYKVHVILPCDGPLVKEIKKINDIDLIIYDLAILRRKNLNLMGIIKYLKKLKNSISFIRKYIRKNKIDIVETNTSVVFPGAIAAKKENVKSIWHIREIIKNKCENKFISFMMNRYSDIIIANSKSTGDNLCVKKNKLRVIYNSISFGEIQNHSNTPIIGMAGRINRWKGQKLFIESAKIVLEKIPDAKFIIAGEAYAGEEYLKEELINLIDLYNLSDNVKLLGQVDNMDEFYKNISIFVLPSIQPEPFGLVVIEAMSRGIPVIATNHGGPTEIITNDYNGYLVDHTKPEQIANKIIKLVQNEKKYNSISKNGEIDAKRRFSIETMICEIEKIYNELK